MRAHVFSPWLLFTVFLAGCPSEPSPAGTSGASSGSSGGAGGTSTGGAGGMVSSSSSGSGGMAAGGAGGAGGMAAGGAAGMGGMATGGAGGNAGAGGGGGVSGCPVGQHLCGLVCESNSSLETCGDACEPCPSVPNGAAICNGSMCGAQCDAGEKACNGACIATCYACPAAPIARCPAGFEPYTFTEQLVSTVVKGVSNARIQIDPGGFIHTAFTNRTVPVHIEYASNRSGAWVVETVANASAQPSAAVSRAHLVMAACGAPAVAYMRSHVPAGGNGVQQMWLATKSGAIWTEQMVPVPTSSVDPTPSTFVTSFDIQSDESGIMYAVARVGNSAFVMQRSVAGVWTTETLPFFVYGIEAPVMSLHPTMGVILAYGDVPKVAIKEGGTWKESVVPGAKQLISTSFNHHPRIGVAADAAGTVYLAWSAGEANGSDTLYVSRRIAGTWTAPVQHSNASGWAGDNLHVWMDAKNLARLTHESYASGGSVSPQWSLVEDDGWLKRSISTGVSGTAVGNTDDVGRLFLLVGDNMGLKMRYQSCAPCSGGFCPEVVAGAGVAGTSLALAVNQANQPVISYSDTTSPTRLRFARWNGSTWKRETVATGSAGHQSLALDSNDLPQISYWDVTNGDLKRAAFDGANWIIDTIDSMGSVGAFNSIAIDKADHAHISYFDSTNSDLKYARWTGTMWETVTVDSTGDMGRFGSLALDAQDHPHIAYLDFDARDLKYATFDGVTWKIETLDPASAANGTSIAIDAAGRPHILYYDAAFTNDVKYAKWDGTQWVIELVLAQGDVGYAPDLALDAEGTPHIVFGDLSAKSVRYGRKTPMGWVFQTVDTFSNASGTNAIVVDAKGRVHLAFDDPNNSDVRYARQ